MDKIIKKKKYGQHFLIDNNIALKTVKSLSLLHKSYNNLLEIGAGDGMLTTILLKDKKTKLYIAEIDKDLINILSEKFPSLGNNLLNVDFLKLNFQKKFEEQTGIIGNFPYNISSQILFRIIENRAIVPEMVGMFQKEVAERVTSIPGNKIYGKISVLIQAFYKTEMLFKVSNNVFSPKPQVESAVIRLVRKENFELDCNEKIFFSIVKSSFNQRRKTLKNSLSQYRNFFPNVEENILSKRPEVLSVIDFINLSKKLEN